jgi:hypothetical protein
VSTCCIALPRKAMTKSPSQEWLLIFYSVPAHPVSGRMKVWRRLAKAGAVQLKGAVYILPSTDEHRELFQWIIGEVKAIGGDGSFVHTSRIETISDSEVRGLFNAQRDTEYRDLEKALEVLERKVQSSRKGAVAGVRESVGSDLASLRKTYAEIGGRDFFGAPLGRETGRRIQTLEAAIKGLQEPGPVKAVPLSRKDTKDYRRKV